MPEIDLPYFDRMLALRDFNPEAQLAGLLGDMHWGCYADPDNADDSVQEYAEAAAALTQRITDEAGIRDGMRVLDVGCGFGATIEYLNDTRSDCLLVGLNIDARQLAVAREKVDAANGNNVTFVNADATVLPFVASSFDVVLAVECIFHFPSRRAFFAEASRVLGPERVVALCDWTLNEPALLQYASDAFRDGAASAPESHSFFGSSNGPTISTRKYERLGNRAHMALRSDVDISANIRPTYRALQALYADAGWPDGVAQVAGMEEFAELGVLEYHILSFRTARAR
jgi:SAM-dependent methyltransferase